MISEPTKLSLAQFLGLHRARFIDGLLRKNGIETWGFNLERGAQPADIEAIIAQILDAAEPDAVLHLLGEVGRTQDDLRVRVGTRSRHHQRLADLGRHLELDGYRLTEEGLQELDASVRDAEPIHDAVMTAVESSGLAAASEAIRALQRARAAYLMPRFDYNDCLDHARIALQTLARSLAEDRTTDDAPGFNPEVWGQVVAHLRVLDLITAQEEGGLTGVFTFLSPAAHRLVGFGEREMARLGLSFAMGMCYFLAKLAID